MMKKKFIAVVMALTMMLSLGAITASAANLGVSVHEGRNLVYTKQVPIQVPDTSKGAVIIMKNDKPIIISYGSDSEQSGYAVDILNLLDPVPQNELDAMSEDTYH